MRFPTGIISGLFLITFAVIFLFLITPAQAYDITYVGKDNAGATIKAIRPPSVYWNLPCSVNMTLKNTAETLGSSYIINQYLNPYYNITASSYNSYSSNFSCQYMNINPVIGNSALNYYYEAGVNSTTSATTFNGYLINTYSCATNNNWFSYYGSNTIKDSAGNYPEAYGNAFYVSCTTLDPLANDLGDIIDYLQKRYYAAINGGCGDMTSTDVNRYGNDAQTCGPAGAMETYQNYWTMIPFKTSIDYGLINISVASVIFDETSSAGCFPRANSAHAVYLYDRNLNSTTLLSSTIPYTANDYNLLKNHNYWLLIGASARLSIASPYACTINYNSTNFNLSVFDYRPDWDCGNWSNCIGGKKTRLCLDLNGVASPKVEELICDNIILENATLGFERYTETTATKCGNDYSIISAFAGLFGYNACYYLPKNITVRRPENWSFSDEYLGWKRYYADMTNEWATEGGLSLKLWTIPASPFYLMNPPTTCSNNTEAISPTITNTDLSNSTMSVSYNVTFPATNMRLHFDIARCLKPVQQNDRLTLLNVGNITFGGTLISQEDVICEKDCYNSSCYDSPTGSVIFDIRINGSSASLLNTPFSFDVAGDLAIPYEIDLSPLGLVPGAVYQISFTVAPNDPNTNKANCIMIDDVRYDVLATPSLCAPPSKCRGDGTYITVYTTGNGQHICSLEPNSDKCTAIHSSEIINRANYCKDGVTLLFVNNFTRMYEELNCEYGCSAGKCLSEGETPETTTAPLQR